MNHELMEECVKQTKKLQLSVKLLEILLIALEEYVVPKDEFKDHYKETIEQVKKSIGALKEEKK